MLFSLLMTRIIEEKHPVLDLPTILWPYLVTDILIELKFSTSNSNILSYSKTKKILEKEK